MKDKEIKVFTSKSLAVKYRPLKFQDVVGQPDVVAKIKGMLKSHNLPSLLLTGGTGRGKTTLARIIARYLNCKDMTACGKCENCQMEGDTHPDYEEINCADETGIEFARNVIRRARNMPRIGRMRIFVLDECFPADTEVEISPGVYKTISDICSDESVLKVLSYNHNLSSVEEKSIISRTPSCKDTMVEVHLSDGGVQDCTDSHEWWSVTRGCYVKASDLVEGEQLLVRGDNATD